MTKSLLLVLYCILLAIGNCGGPLILRLYFVQGGQNIWLSSWLQTAAWPLIFIPLIISYLHRRKTEGLNTKLYFMNYPIFTGTAVIGILTGVDNYFYAYGIARLPVSTSSIIIATQLAFTALFAFLLVKQKFTAFSVNAVVLLTMGSVVLALGASSDRPESESKKLYVLGFMMTVAAAALYGLILPMVESMYLKAKQVVTYTLVLEIQLVLCFFATVFCTVGMLVNSDFQTIPREAREYELGEKKYYMVLFWSAIILQCFFLGSIGVISCASSLLSGVMIAVLLPVTEILAVLFFHENFRTGKCVALFLSVWGYVSYCYGENKYNQKKVEAQDNVQSQTTVMILTIAP